MSRRRVVVTGLGAVSPFGVGVLPLWEGLKAGRSGIRPISLFDAKDFPVRFAGEVPDFDPLAFFEKKEARHYDRVTQFALVCAEEARRDADLDLDAVDRARVGVVVGSGIGGLDTTEKQVLTLHQKGVRRVSPFLVPMMMINAPGGQVAIKLGLQGPNFCVASACASANHALGVSMHMIRHGQADIVFAGGSEAALTPVGLAGFCAARALSKRNDDPQRASRPFDANRDGFVFGEGAGLLVLEEREHALARGARIYCEFSGFGNTDDAFHITAPHEEGEGASRAMRAALEDAGLAPEQIDYVNAHGTSTKLNDPLETKAIKRVFGEHAGKLAVSSTKSMTGHLLGASGGIEAVALSKSIADGLAPPTINYETPDPECDLDYVPNEARAMDIGAALSNTFGFGGHNACLVFQKHA
ncbi:MAG: beta-ketoacyl-[acyl-carrier-protein] synthase II [Planctomycetota bacterium]|nr:MAG: beta-ketoacyl-[acyl-carrier-protein] synthase II [Planctomycetota bacterium]